jgi:hypothetical protein
MINTKSQSLKTRRLTVNKLALWFTGIISAVVVGSAGIAAANPTNDNSSNTPSVVAFCKEHYKQLGFKNVGQCVSHLNGHGHGYGGSGNDNDNHGNHKHHHDNFFGSWWHRFEHDF